jgi:arylsulfatase A-like enzyme
MLSETALMNRRNFLASAAAGVAAAQAQPPRPNVVLFLADDLGYADLGCTGADYLKTPNIDALAKSGTRMTNWYSNAPMCAPSRAALLTGRYPHRAGVTLNGQSLPADRTTVARMLKAQGYETGLVGKWHLGSEKDTVPNAHGFGSYYGFLSGCIDYYSHRYYWGEPRKVNYHDLWRNRQEIFEDGEYFTDSMTREALTFIRRAGQQPFFLYAAFSAPHYPMHAPRRYMDRFPGLSPEQQTRAAMISAMDDAVGAIVKAAGPNTLIFFSADNGATREPRAGLDQKPPETGSNLPFRGYKFSLFDGGVHVPMIVRWQGRVPAGAVNKSVGAHMDMLPTIAAACRVLPPSDIDGMNMLPAITQSGRSAVRTEKDRVFWQSGKQTAVREGAWKLVVNGFNAEGAGETRQPLQGEDSVFLSNLDNDPGELTNLRRQHSDVVDRLLTEIQKWSREQ